MSEPLKRPPVNQTGSIRTSLLGMGSVHYELHPFAFDPVRKILVFRCEGVKPFEIGFDVLYMASCPVGQSHLPCPCMHAPVCAHTQYHSFAESTKMSNPKCAFASVRAGRAKFVYLFIIYISLKAYRKHTHG